MKSTAKRKPSLLWSIAKGSRRLYFLAFLFMMLTIFANYLTPQIIRFAVDSVVGDEPVPQIWPVQTLVQRAGGVEFLREHVIWLGVLVLIVAAVGGFSNFLYRRTLSIGAEGMIKRLRDRLFSHIQYLPYKWHINIQTGDIIQRCTSDVETVRNFVANQFLEMVRTILLVVFAYSILFPMNATMAAASFAFLPVIFVYSFVFLSMASKRFLAADEAEGLLLSIAQENFTGVRVVRAFGRERYEVDKFHRQNQYFSELWMRLGNLLGVYWGTGDLIVGLQMVTICIVGIFQAYQGNITVGSFMVFLTYNSMTIWPVRGLGRILSEASKTKVSLGRLREILDAPTEQDAANADEPSIAGDIVFDNVHFSYGEQPVLDGVSFTIREGSTLGILGTTGSGKTTIAHLLCRLYDLEEDGGRITIGGRDIKTIRLGWLRRHIGIVMQEPFLYSRTIRENIASLSDGYSMEEIKQAARIACIDESVEQFPDGYNTVIGERGVTLSGGQKQRVAIARSILRNPPIIVFDDSLSAVDTETDARIRGALSGRTENATTIIVSHRITSLSRAGCILVMDQGRILERGTHEELLSQGGVYRRIYDMQESLEGENPGEVSTP